MSVSEKNDEFMGLLMPVYKNLEKYALSLTGNRENAKDIVGETVLKAFESFSSLKDRKAFLSYLFTIAHRVFLGAYRKMSRMQSADPYEFDELFGEGQSPEYYTDAGILYETLDKLPVKEKEALLLFDIMGFSYKEICEIQNSTMAIIKIRLHRGRKKLASLLKAIPGENEKVRKPHKLEYSSALLEGETK